MNNSTDAGFYVVPIGSPETTSSTRRFCCLRAAVSLLATGCPSPNPADEMLPRAKALRREVLAHGGGAAFSCWLYASAPTRLLRARPRHR